VDLLKFYLGLIVAYTKTKKTKIRFFTVVPAFQLSWVLRLPTLKTKEIKYKEAPWLLLPLCIFCHPVK
jgi:hypothetical protein